MTSQPEPAEAAELRADIAATRSDLAETLAALAAKTQIRARAADAARTALAHTKDDLGSASAQMLGGVNLLFRRVRSRTTPAQRRLGAFAVLAGGLTALAALYGTADKRGHR